MYKKQSFILSIMFLSVYCIPTYAICVYFPSIIVITMSNTTVTINRFACSLPKYSSCKRSLFFLVNHTPLRIFFHICQEYVFVCCLYLHIYGFYYCIYTLKAYIHAFVSSCDKSQSNSFILCFLCLSSRSVIHYFSFVSLFSRRRH